MDINNNNNNNQLSEKQKKISTFIAMIVLYVSGFYAAYTSLFNNDVDFLRILVMLFGIVLILRASKLLHDQ